MGWTTNILVLANRTVGSEHLREIVVGRARRGPIAVTIVAPTADDERDAVAQRLELAVKGLREAGLEIEGQIGDADPMTAVADIWEPGRFTEVIITTLPGGESRWLTIDLPHRVELFTGVRVTHLVAPVGEPVV